MNDMRDNEIEKTFVERSPASLMSPFPLQGGGGMSMSMGMGMGMAMSGSRPLIGQTRFGSSVITEVIGEGGMAVVYKAWNERLEVYRAIKLLSQESFYARFETEAKIIAKLRHECIVEVYNVAEWNGLPYMEMEYVDGSDLQQTIAGRGRLPEPVCLAIAISVAEALSHAHTQTFTLIGNQYSGIIHRDLKPANIMLSKNGEVKITDFGIARPTEASIHTVESSIVGTLHYLSPEQMECGDIDNRSDIYSLGTILYEMITGEKTFPFDSTSELMRQKSANKFKMPQEHGVPVSPELVKIICRCLRRSPDKRYQSAHELANDLRELYASHTKLPARTVVKNYLSDSDTPAPDDPTPAKKNDTNGAGALNSTDGFDVFIKPTLSEKIAAIRFRTADIVGRQNFRRNLSITVLTALIAFAAPYTIVKIVTAKQSAKIADANIKTAEAIDSAISLPAQSADTPIVKSPAQTRAASRAARQAAAPQPPPPVKTTADAETEEQKLREAVAAVNARQWDKAIEILEIDSIYKKRNNFRTLQLFNAYVEARKFDKAQTMMDTAAIAQDAYFLFCTGKYWRYRGFANQAITAFEASLTRTSMISTKGVVPEASLYYIAEIRHDRYQKDPSSANKTAALESWLKAREALSSTPNGAWYKRAEKEIAALSGE